MGQKKVRDFKKEISSEPQFAVINTDKNGLFKVRRLSDDAIFTLMSAYSLLEENNMLTITYFHEDLIHVEFNITVYSTSQDGEREEFLLEGGTAEINRFDISPNSFAYRKKIK